MKKKKYNKGVKRTYALRYYDPLCDFPFIIDSPSRVLNDNNKYLCIFEMPKIENK